MHTPFNKSLFFFALTIALFPLSTSAASTDLTVSGWMPYWRDSESIKDAKKHITALNTVYPFVFSVMSDGGIKDLGGLSDKEWKSFIKTARAKDVEIIPTVMWSDGASTEAVLSNDVSRKHHIDVIMHMIEKGKYDGVDIDYEGKNAETINYFSLFLMELKKELGKKVLSCTVEARTPPESLYREMPTELRYANDYNVIGKVCDRVIIMAYDQQRADLLLNDSRNGKPYIPVADVDWVRKVVELALVNIPKEKLVLGIPTYGHHWAITVASYWYRDYRKIGALNVPDMLDVAKEYKVTPMRNAAGEMSFTYLPKSMDAKLAKAVKKMSVPKDTPKGNLIAAQALAYANKTGKNVTFNIGWYSDASAIIDKINLAKESNLLGVSLFKIDGEEDQKIWEVLK